MNTRASAYVHRQRLCVIGVTENKLGPIPFAVSVNLKSEQPEGPVDLSSDLSDDMLEAVDIARDKIKETIDSGKLELAAENLVLRARQGDQNAMAVLMQVKKNARKGIPKAQKSLSVIKKFIKKNPSEETVSFGIEDKLMTVDPEDPYQRNANIITYGPSINPARLICVLANGKIKASDLFHTFDADLKPSFKLGFDLAPEPKLFVKAVCKLSRECYDAAKVGFLTGRALLIKEVRKGGPVALLCPRASWELGE